MPSYALNKPRILPIFSKEEGPKAKLMNTFMTQILATWQCLIRTSASWALLGFVLVTACGKAGETTSDQQLSLNGQAADIIGSISTQSGGQSDMRGWIVVLVDRDSGLSRVAEVDAAGIYRLRQVPTDKAFTIVLLTPDFIVNSVLSLPSPVQNTIRQFFSIQSSVLPRLINRGDVVVFDKIEGISVTNDLAADADGDGVPDGMAAFGLAASPGASNSDLDADGTPDNVDADIDGDGVINWFDPDDDGDGLLDVVDLDANGNLVMDSQEQTIDVFFKQGLEWVSATVEKTPEGATQKTTIQLATKMNTLYAAPLAITVRSAANILNSATVEYVDSETGEESSQAFLDRRLFDDGHNEDGSENDYLFGRKITLAAGVSLRSNQMLFIQMAYGDPADPWFVEFPFLLPAIKPKSITARFDSSTRTINLIGNPFSNLQDYLWTVKVFDPDGLLLHSSVPVLGSQTKLQVISEDLLDTGTYTFRVMAQLLDRIPGYPSFIINTPSYDLK